MRASELIERLQELMESYGDSEICIQKDADFCPMTFIEVRQFGIFVIYE